MTTKLTRKSLLILRILNELGSRQLFCSFGSSQGELATRLKLTRQGLSVHLKRLRELGLVQVGRGFINVTAAGLQAIGYNSNPVIVLVRMAPKSRTASLAKLDSLPTLEIFRVTGDYDIVFIVEQEELDHVIAEMYQIEGIIEVKSLITIQKR